MGSIVRKAHNIRQQSTQQRLSREPLPTNLYERLGVTSTATQEEIKNAYRAKTQLYHPDKNPLDKDLAHEKFVQIGEAYKTLSDKLMRESYDRNPPPPKPEPKSPPQQRYHTNIKPQFEYSSESWTTESSRYYTQNEPKPKPYKNHSDIWRFEE